MASEIIPGDKGMLLLTAIVTIAYQLFFFAIAAFFKFDKVTDLAGGTNFVLLTFLTFSLGSATYSSTSAQQIAVTALVATWGLRLSGFLFYRILMISEDHRFDGMREDPLKFLVFWIFQMLWVWVVSLPVTYINSTPYSGSDPNSLTYVDAIGVAVAGLGLLIEAAADQSKFYFKQDDRNRGKWCDVGIWYYSRHPNYFGEILFWWGIFITVSSAFTGSESYAYYTILSPIFLTALLLGLSGLPLLESGANKRFGRRHDYRAYRNRTSILIPLPPSVYEKTPPMIKAVLLFEWSIYESGLETEMDTESVRGYENDRGYEDGDRENDSARR